MIADMSASLHSRPTGRAGSSTRNFGRDGIYGLSEEGSPVGLNDPGSGTETAPDPGVVMGERQPTAAADSSSGALVRIR
ncbi:hypothetical protein RE9425_28420 [Prescottella equi]|nr:hypothetical protein RE9425_28420 [Prescottella equi]